MRKITRSFIAVALVGFAASCGGSGGGNDDEAFVGGVWTGALTKVTDTCNAGDPQTINFSHTVNQNEEAVTVAEANGINYVGSTVGDDGFSVDGSQGVTNQCTRSQQIEYNNVDEDSDNTASVDYRIRQVCPNGATCEVAYTGTAARTNNGSATPTPTPTPGSGGGTTVTGGCADIIENTASGTYTGDGGCGISEVVYDVSDQGGQTVVILNPFGANGATSFNINAANTSAASSARTDLTIAGTAGYSCSLTCSAPSTFTLNCFKEGGTTCVEKF